MHILYVFHAYFLLLSNTSIMASVRVNFVTDDVTKKRAQHVFSRLGLDLSTGLNIYLHRVAEHGGIPFCMELPGSARPRKK